MATTTTGNYDSPMIVYSRSMLVTLMLLAGGCGGTKPKVSTTDATGAAHVALHQSYFLEVAESPPQGYSTSKRSRTVLDMARPKVDAELGRKGYVVAPSEGEADLIVRIAVGVKLVVDDQPSAAARAVGNESDLDEVSTLAVSIMNRRTKETLFVGNAKKEIHSSNVKEADVTAAVAEILETVPAALPPPR